MIGRTRNIHLPFDPLYKQNFGGNIPLIDKTSRSASSCQFVVNEGNQITYFLIV